MGNYEGRFVQMSVFNYNVQRPIKTSVNLSNFKFNYLKN